MQNPDNNELLSKYNPLSADFFFRACLKLPTNRKECLLDQIEKYHSMIQDDKTRSELNELAKFYLRKT
jgi:hypothetical protein